ncbi:MAG: rod shape-determining protein MreD [Steroidobacteraceae bacterium]
MSGRVGVMRVLLTSAVALLLTIVPLPAIINMGRPDWLILLVIYWSLNAPMLAGLTYAWICGLILDALIGNLIGQHALAFVLVATAAQHFQLRIRVFPVPHQAVVVLLLLALYHFLLFWIDGIVGTAVASWLRWLPAVVGALLWPLLVAVLDTSNRHLR